MLVAHFRLSQRCESALCEDFESATDGGFPKNWGPRADEWGGGVLGVASDDARFGSKSLKADGANDWHQDAGNGYTVWFDELAYDPNIIPCQ